MKSLRGDLFGMEDPYIGHGLGEGNVGFGYKSPKFQWNTRLKASYEPKTAERYRLEAKSGKEERRKKKSLPLLFGRPKVSRSCFN